jgi:hypothetical protein
MSTFITGNAPIGYGQTISGGAPNGSNAFSDADAINNLLNYSGARASATFQNMQLGSNANNMILSQGANKSLLVAYNTPSNVVPANVTNNNITQTNATILDTFGFNKTASTILTTELFEMMSVSPNNGNVYTTDTVTYPVQLSENPSGQTSQNALNYMRILNNYLQNTTVQNMHANGPHNIQYNVSTIANALGTEGVAYYYFGQVNTAPYYLNVSAYETLASNNITLNVSALNTLNATYTYELMKVSYTNPTFAINYTGAGAAHIVDAFGTSNVTPVNAQSSYTYTGFLQSYNYTGLMGATYSSVYSSQLDILLSNPANVTQAFTFASGNTGLNVSNGWVTLNTLNSLALVQNTTFANVMNVTINPSSTTVQATSYNNTASVVIVQQSELLPATHTVDPMQLNFFSQNNRNTFTNNGAYNTFNTTVIYQVDNLTGMSYLTSAAMAAVGSAAVINTTMTGPSTITTAPQFNVTAGYGNSTATLNGLYAFYDTNPVQGYSGFSVTALQVTGSNVNVMGMLSSSVNMNFTNYSNITAGYNGSHLPLVTPGANNNYNSSNSTWNWTNSASYLQLEGSFPSNNILGFGVLSGFVNSDLEGVMASLNQFRLLLEPTDPLGTAIVNQTGANVILSNASLNYGGGGVNPTFGSALEYKVAYNGNGPVSYADFPAGTYRQSYSLVFPTAGELMGGILRPQQVLVNGYNASGAQLNSQTMVMSLCSSNFSGLSLQTVGQQTTISYNLVIDVALSGLKAFDCRNVAGSQNSGSMYVNIPVSYTVTNNGGGYVYTNGIPSASVNIVFLSQQLYTHKVHMQGLSALSPSGAPLSQATWVDTYNYVNVTQTQYEVNQFWYVDLRESYDILTFSAVNGNDVPYTFSFALYPQVSLSAPSFTNSYYTQQFASTPSGWTSKIFDLNNQANLQAVGFNGLNYDSIVSVTSNPFGVYTSPQVTLTTFGLSSSINLVTPQGVNVTFYLQNSPSGNSPIYFEYTQNALVQSAAGWDGIINALVPNNTLTAIAPGVYIQSANISNGGHSVGDWISTITLTKDQYYGSAYTGQNGMPYNSWQPIPDPVAGVSVLIPASLAPTNPGGVTTQLQTPYVRGFGYQNGVESLTFLRSGISANAVFGAYVDNSNVGIAQAAINAPTVLTFNFGQAFGINLALSVNPTASSLTNFDANKTSVTAVYKGVTYSSVASPSLQILNLVQPVGTSVPWIENLYLNEFFVAGASNTLRIDYQQGPVTFSSASYYTNNAGLNGRQAVEGASYTLRTAYADSQIVNNSYVVGVDQVFTTFNAAYMLRNQAKAFYVTVAPIDVRLGLLSAPNYFSTPTMNYWYVSLNSNSVPVTGVSVDGLNAPYNFLVQYNQQLAKVTPPSTSDFMFYNNLYSLRGSQDSGTIWSTYFTNGDLFNGSNIPSSITVTPLGNFAYSITFQQTGYVPSSGDVVVLTFSGLYMQPLFGGAWSVPITVTPATLSYLAQYELAFSVNNTSKLIQPIVNKYVSQVYNSNYLANLTSTNGYYTQLTCASAQHLNDPVSVSGLPYQYLNATQYPAISNNALLTNPTFSSITVPANMDIAYQVKNGATGSNYYFQWMAVQAGNFVDAKIVSLFAKDQMVVTDYAGNLSMRVGPDGHFYAGDMSTYSIAMNDNQSANPPAINGLLAPILNSDVNLNNPF